MLLILQTVISYFPIDMIVCIKEIYLNAIQMMSRTVIQVVDIIVGVTSDVQKLLSVCTSELLVLKIILINYCLALLLD